MCLIALARGVAPEAPLLVAANRDEFHDRPTLPLHFWPSDPEVLAGRDLREGGTWLGVSRAGRIAAVTNARVTLAAARDARSRGYLVLDFLRSDLPPEEYLDGVLAHGELYRPFHLVVGTPDQLVYAGSGPTGPRTLGPGVHVLTNAPRGEEWPKAAKARKRLEALLATGDAPGPDALLELLADTEPAPDTELPDSGAGRGIERALSPIRIDTPEYGTRSSTVVRVGRDGVVEVVERTFRRGRGHEDVRRSFRIREQARARTGLTDG